MEDTNVNKNDSVISDAPKKRGRPPKAKGSRKSSQATISQRRREEYKQKILTTTSEQIATSSSTNPTKNCCIEPFAVDTTDTDIFMDVDNNEVEISVSKNVISSTTLIQTASPLQISSTSALKRKLCRNSEPTSLPSKSFDDVSQNISLMHIKSNDALHSKNHTADYDPIEVTNDSTDDNGDSEDTDDEGMPVDFEIALKSNDRPDEHDDEHEVNDNPEPIDYIPEDEDETHASLQYDDGHVGFTDRNLTTPDPLYRSGLEIAVFLTAMVKFAVEDGKRWHGIGILDPVICGIRNFDNDPARTYMRGYRDAPALILHPAIFGANNSNVGHWILIVFDVHSETVTLYDPLRISMHLDEPADHYIAYCHKISMYLIKSNYLHTVPRYVHPSLNSYNVQTDPFNCGVHIARIAEEIAFTGSTRELYPFEIEQELHRLLHVCRDIHHLGGLPSQWPPTLQSMAFPLPSEPVTRMTIKNIAPVKFAQKQTSKHINVVSDVSDVPIKLRRSTRGPTQEATAASTIELYKVRLQQKMRLARKNNVPFGCTSSHILPLPFSIGPMNKCCPHCKARLFEDETSNRCCSFGTVPPPDLPPYPLEMEAIFKEPTYWKNIRMLNSMFSMVTVTANVQPKMDVFVVSGEFKFGIGDILPQNGMPPRFEQNYVIDSDAAVTNRLNDAAAFGLNPAKFCDRRTLDRLEAMLRKHHPLPRMYCFAAELYHKALAEAESRGEDAERVYLIWQARKPNDGSHNGQYNTPTVNNTMFKIWRSSDGSVPEQCLMIAVQRNNHSIRPIPYFNCHIDPAAYPLMFFYGQQGWTPHQPKLNPVNSHVHMDSVDAVNSQSTQESETKFVNEAMYSTKHAKIPLSTSSRITRQSTQFSTATSSQNRIDSAQPTTKILPSQALSLLSIDNAQDASSDSDDDCDNEDGESRSKRTNPFISARSFYMSQMYDRTDEQQFVFHPVTGARKLTQVRSIDVYTRIEAEKLKKLQIIQEQLEKRAERCKTLRQTLERLKNKNGKYSNMKLGRIILLTHKYRGGPADMQRRYQNAVAINVRVGNGRSDLFVTFTGNPMWPEIQDNLRRNFDPPEQWTDRPDLVNRVFVLYAKEFLRDVLDHGVLGKVEGYNYSVEHQKRGMPHIHLLLILSKKDRKRLSTSVGLDDLLSAQIPTKPSPDGTTEAELLREYADFVTSKMVHNPARCPQYCGMNKRHPNVCSKQYPKPFLEKTMPNTLGYAELQRPDNGLFISNNRKKTTMKLTNQHIVPHNRYLLLKYRCHINVECVRNVRSVKYIYKYSFKGHDRGFVQPVRALGSGIDADTIDYNEIEMYRSTRVMGAAEADLRMRTGLPITKCSHTVIVLPLHLPLEHNIVFAVNDPVSEIARKTIEDGVHEDSSAVSQLTAFFKVVQLEKSNDRLCRDSTSACNLRYHKLPEHYTWNNRKKEWTRRKVDRKTIGRIATVFPSNRERFCLRELLRVRCGPRSYEDLRTVNNVIHPTFESAAFALHLFVDDRYFEQVMNEVCDVLMPPKCRVTFALLIAFNRPHDPMALWNKFEEQLLNRRPVGLSRETRVRRALSHIASILHHHSITMTDASLPTVTDDELEDALINEFDDDDNNGNDPDGMISYANMNAEQALFVDSVLDAVNDPKKPKLFFLQGSGGTGKTYIYNTLIRRLQSQGKRVLPMASTGVAAILLQGGQTVHSAFRLPIDTDELRSLSAQDAKAKAATQADVLILDEAPMQSNLILRTVDRLLRDWTGVKIPFGGKIVILGGDFKQLLPVVPGGTVQQSFESSILCCSLFVDNFVVFTLHQNMRAQRDSQYADWLQNVGTGEDRTWDPRPGKTGQTVLQIPDAFVERNAKTVVDFVYPSAIFDQAYPIERFEADVQSSAIVAPTNALVDRYNNMVIKRLPTAAKHYVAVNTVFSTENSEEDTLRPIADTESMAVFEKPGFPPQNLVLKERSVVMLTRNICVALGLCNGTRMIVEKLGETAIVCRVITGRMSGTQFAVTKLEHDHDDKKDDAFPPFTRLQFPLRPAFAMSINKAQGQTLSRVGIMLDTPCFSHGQLYVAFSRAGESRNVRVFLPSTDIIRDHNRFIGITKNIVYRQVLAAVNNQMKQLGS